MTLNGDDMLYDFLIIVTCVLWCLICVAILMYLNLDKLRTQTQRIWTRNRDDIEAWYGIHFSSRKPHQQVAELTGARAVSDCGDPEWWGEFVSCYNESAERYAQRLHAPVFRKLGAVLRFREMPRL